MRIALPVVAAAAVLLLAGFFLYELGFGSVFYSAQVLDPTTPAKLPLQAQLKVSIYDFDTRRLSMPMTRQRAESEMASGLHPNGQIVAKHTLPDIDATDITIPWDKAINPVVVKNPAGAIVDGTEYAIVNR